MLVSLYMIACNSGFCLRRSPDHGTVEVVVVVVGTTFNFDFFEIETFL